MKKGWDYLKIFFMYLIIYILFNQRLLVLQVVTKEDSNKLWATTTALQQLRGKP